MAPGLGLVTRGTHGLHDTTLPVSPAVWGPLIRYHKIGQADGHSPGVDILYKLDNKTRVYKDLFNSNDWDRIQVSTT